MSDDRVVQTESICYLLCCAMWSNVAIMQPNQSYAMAEQYTADDHQSTTHIFNVA